MKREELTYLEEKAKRVRYLTIDEIATLGVGHAGGCMSVIEALVTIHYRHMKNRDPKNPNKEGRDRFVLSKGHAGPSLYAILADQGYFEMDMLKTLNRPSTMLPSHSDMLRTPGVDMTTGSLGQGLSCAVGLALGAKVKDDGANVYVIMGDGEISEGQIWEAATFAAHRKLDNLIAFVDSNKMQIDGLVEDVSGIEPLTDKWEAFGFYVQRVDGHDIEAIDQAIANAKGYSGKPSMIILDTLKGKGVSFLEATWKNNHNVKISKEQRELALSELS